MREDFLRAHLNKGYSMNYELDGLIADISKSIEDLTYRVYRLEDSLATISGYIEEEKGEHIDA